ncbi:hypothetical protein FDW94_10315 [Citrobacter sp. wls757]|nr:hypothetical protein FDW94_10315 [Citrobacter sp. wls757]
MFGGLAESENVSQYFDFIGYLSIQLSVVYLSVYQWRFAVVFTLVLQTCFFEWNASKKSFFAFNCSHCSPLVFYQ